MSARYYTYFINRKRRYRKNVEIATKKIGTPSFVNPRAGELVLGAAGVWSWSLERGQVCHFTISSVPGQLQLPSSPRHQLQVRTHDESPLRRGGPNNARGECLDMLVCIRLNSSPQKSTINNNNQKIFSFVEFLRLRIMIYVGKESMLWD